MRGFVLLVLIPLCVGFIPPGEKRQQGLDGSKKGQPVFRGQHGSIVSRERSQPGLWRQDGSMVSGVKTIYFQPEQIHLSYGAAPTEMVVTWVTMDATNQSVVEYGETGLHVTASGYQSEFLMDWDVNNTRAIYIHRVTLTRLIPGNSYLYHVGSDLGWSGLFTFKAMTAGTNWSPRFAVYGDLGNENAQSLPRLQGEVQRGMYDAILHVGDFAYDMDLEVSEVGDEFMRQIESIAGYVPYMTCPGNHEHRYNFTNYNYRFTMVSQKERKVNNFFYSWDIGPAHIISFNTEYYFYPEFYNISEVVQAQYEWLEADLQEATRNRHDRPWIITMGHRPFYCSNNDSDECTTDTNVVRVGINNTLALEDLFYNYGVDLEIWAHEHSYERLWPVYNMTILNGSYEAPYTNPKAPVQIITGSAGCWSEHDIFQYTDYEWSAFRSVDYGYTRMYVINQTHLYMEQVSDDKGGEVIDSMLLIKDLHGPEAWL